MSYRTLILPAQELAELQSAAEQSPAFAHLLKRLPGFQFALANPLPDSVAFVARGAQLAADKVQENTNYPHDWDDLITAAEQLEDACQRACEQQAAAQASDTPPDAAPDACPCCGGVRFARSQSVGNMHWFELRHLGFSADNTYTPSQMGIPTGGGPYVKVCLDCGRVVNGVYPLPAEVLQERIRAYRYENCLDENDQEIV